jgi:uncharacterized metal-binding protein (TIGR02443 family)
MTVMTNRKKQFIAGAVCPNCSDMDSLMLYTDDQSVECVSCDYTQTSEQRDQQAKQTENQQPAKLERQPSSSSNKSKNVKYKDASLIDITQLKE